MSQIQGVIVIARNGDRKELYQDPKTYVGGFTETTPLGVVQSHQLGEILRKEYLENGPSAIRGMKTDTIDTNEIHVAIKAGVEGPVVFDSGIATLQGLFPPTPKNKLTLANGTTVVAPLGGYQYVPATTVEPGNDRSLESWTDCPKFEQHIAGFYKSDEFKKEAEAARPFFKAAGDFLFGRPATLENAWNVHDYMNSELTHNQTYAFRLPPFLIQQARGFADFHEYGVFTDKEIGGIGHIAGRTILSPITTILERIAFNDDPLKFMLLETTYHPIISLLNMFEISKEHPELKGIPDYTSALVIELRKGAPPEDREFLRFKFRNGTNGFETVHAFGHKGDIPLTEFIYRTENYAINSNSDWASACGAGFAPVGLLDTSKPSVQAVGSGIMAIFLLFGLFVLSKFVRRHRAAKAEGRLRLPGNENTNVTSEKTGLIGGRLV